MGSKTFVMLKLLNGIETVQCCCNKFCRLSGPVPYKRLPICLHLFSSTMAYILSLYFMVSMFTSGGSSGVLRVPWNHPLKYLQLLNLVLQEKKLSKNTTLIPTA